MAQANSGMVAGTYTLRGEKTYDNDTSAWLVGTDYISPYYESNKEAIKTAFGYSTNPSRCSESGTGRSSYFYCYVSGLNAIANADGYVSAGDNDGSRCDVDDDGNVKIMAANKELLEAAKQRVLASTAEAEIGKIYRGKVVSIRDFGAFVEILPGQEGLLHISEMANYRVAAVTDILSENDFVTVKVIDIDNADISGTANIKTNGDGSIDIDALKACLDAAADSSGPVVQQIPLLGPVTFAKEDIQKLYDFIVKS